MANQDTERLIPQQDIDDLGKINTLLEQALSNTIELVGESRKIQFGISGGGKTLSDAAVNSQKAAKANDELTLSLKEYKKMADQLAATQARLNALESDTAKQLTSLKMTQQQRNQELKREAELQQTVNGSIEQARAVVKNLTAERNKLDLTTAQGRARQQELNNEIDKQNDFIRENVDAYTKQKINIGNYSGALKILESELATIRQRIDDYTKSGNQNGDMLVRLQKEEELLARLVNSQEAGFASATGELKNNEKALQALAAAGLKNTEFYQQLLIETAELKDNVGDLKAEIKNLASDTKVIDGLVGSAQLLAGSYGVATAAAELFGVENEDLQKSMQKLQAVTTLMVGLQSIANALQKESSVMLFANMVRTKAMAAAQWLYNYAVNAGSASLRAFRTALISTGLGTIIVLLSSAAYAASKFADGIDDSTESLKKNNEQLKINKQLSDEFIDGHRKESERTIAQMEAEGATAEDIRKQKVADANEEINLRKTVLDRATANLNNYADIFAKVGKKSEKITEDEAKLAMDAMAAKNEAAKEYYDAEDRRDILLFNNQKERNEERKKAAEKAAAEGKKRAEEAAERNKKEFETQFSLSMKASERRAAEFKKGVDDETLSLDQRLAYLNKYYNEKEQQARASADYEAVTGKKTALEIAAIEADKLDAINAIALEKGREYNEIIKSIADEETRYRIEAVEKITTNLTIQEQKEVSALTQQLKNKQLTIEEYERGVKAIRERFAADNLQQTMDYLGEQLNNEKLTGEERIALQQKLDEARLESAKLADDKIYDSSKKLADKQRGIQKELADAFIDIINTSYENQTTATETRLEEIEQEEEAEIRKVKRTVTDKDEQEKQIRDIELRAQNDRDQLEAKKKKIAASQAQFAKAISIAQVTMNTAQAIMKNTADLGLLPAIPVNIATGILGAAQLAAVLGTKIPQYKEGVAYHPHDGFAVLGDGNEPELVRERSGKTWWSEDSAGLYYMQQGASVTPLSDLQVSSDGMLSSRLTNGAGVSQTVDLSPLRNDIKALGAIMVNKPVSSITIDKNGLSQVVTSGNYKTQYLTQNLFD